MTFYQKQYLLSEVWMWLFWPLQNQTLKGGSVTNGIMSVCVCVFRCNHDCTVQPDLCFCIKATLYQQSSFLKAGWYLITEKNFLSYNSNFKKYELYYYHMSVIIPLKLSDNKKCCTDLKSNQNLNESRLRSLQSLQVYYWSVQWMSSVKLYHIHHIRSQTNLV